jgi:hypothetical protein
LPAAAVQREASLGKVVRRLGRVALDLGEPHLREAPLSRAVRRR